MPTSQVIATSQTLGRQNARASTIHIFVSDVPGMACHLLTHGKLRVFVFASTSNHEFMEVELGEKISWRNWEIISSQTHKPTRLIQTSASTL